MKKKKKNITLNDIIISNEKNSNSNKKKIKELEENILSLKSKINELEKNKDKDKITTLKSGEKIIALVFKSTKGEIHKTISCKNTDTFVRIEEKIYNEYPKYKDYNTYLTVNKGKVIRRFKTIDENKIKDGNTIIINKYDK